MLKEKPLLREVLRSVTMPVHAANHRMGERSTTSP